ncbi:MAG TPA: isoprenylcysteine carboxylmethyltransferase family protein [bacterium]|nr:isoprenylcysteine carboxylmethyltransferase family protein [bacterium]
MGRHGTGVLLKIAAKRTTFGWLFFALVIIAGRGGKMHIAAGLPFIAAGVFLRYLSAGTIKKNEVLTVSGIYGICRNPLYMGSFLISAGFTLSSMHPAVLVYFLLFYPLTYLPAILSEERYLYEKFGKSYLDYRKNVPAFFPKFSLRTNLTGNFSWLQANRNREYLNLIAVAITLGILLIKSYLVFQK